MDPGERGALLVVNSSAEGVAGGRGRSASAPGAVAAAVGAQGRTYSDTVRDVARRVHWHHALALLFVVGLGYIVYRVSL